MNLNFGNNLLNRSHPARHSMSTTSENSGPHLTSETALLFTSEGTTHSEININLLSATSKLEHYMTIKDYDNACKAIHEGANLSLTFKIPDGSFIPFLNCAVRKIKIVRAIIAKYLEHERFPFILFELIQEDLKSKKPGTVIKAISEILVGSTEKGELLIEHLAKSFFAFPHRKKTEAFLTVQSKLNYIKIGLCKLNNIFYYFEFLDKILTLLKINYDVLFNEFEKFHSLSEDGNEICKNLDPISYNEITIKNAMSIYRETKEPCYYEFQTLIEMLLDKESRYLKDASTKPVKATLSEDKETIYFECIPQDLYFRDPMGNNIWITLKEGSLFEAFNFHFHNFSFLKSKVEHTMKWIFQEIEMQLPLMRILKVQLPLINEFNNELNNKRLNNFLENHTQENITKLIDQILNSNRRYESLKSCDFPKFAFRTE